VRGGFLLSSLLLPVFIERRPDVALNGGKDLVGFALVLPVAPCVFDDADRISEEVFEGHGYLPELMKNGTARPRIFSIGTAP
jgi:hypothetical protein